LQEFTYNIQNTKGSLLLPTDTVNFVNVIYQNI